MVVEPYAVRIASPTAMPSIRATVTTAEAAPNERWPAASTAAVERGVTVSPNPNPKTPSAAATAVRSRRRGPRRHREQTADAQQRARRG